MLVEVQNLGILKLAVDFSCLCLSQWFSDFTHFSGLTFSTTMFLYCLRGQLIGINKNNFESYQNG